MTGQSVIARSLQKHQSHPCATIHVVESSIDQAGQVGLLILDDWRLS